MAEAPSDPQTQERVEPPQAEPALVPAEQDESNRSVESAEPSEGAADGAQTLSVDDGATMADVESGLQGEPSSEPLGNPENGEGGEPIADAAFEEEDIEADGVVSTLAHDEEGPEAIMAPPVLVDDRYEVHPSRPIPELDSPSARAYEAVDRHNPRISLFALVPIPGMPIRKQELDEIVGHPVPNILPLVDTGIGDWPVYGKQAFFLFFERPAGGRVLNVLRSDLPDYKKIDILRAVVDAIRNAIQQLQFRAIVHQAIRPDNLFFMDEELTDIVLGDFVSAPPSFDQPLAFETIERSMATEAGRGAGTVADDFYSFGATLAFLLQRGNPVRGMSKDQLILSKIMNTSYQTLVGKNLLTPRFLELMRGLLQDDPTQRWGFEAIEQWAHGRRVAATQSTQVQRSQRPFRFGSVDHFQPRSLAFVMSQRRESAIKLIRDGTLETWILRGLEDKDLASSIVGRIDLVDALKDLPDPDEILLTRILLVLDPMAPINYKGLAFFPDAFGDLLAVETMRDGDVRTLAEIVVREIPRIWFEAQVGGIAQNFVEETAFQRLKLHLQKTTPGYGLERCLYEANESIPCKSPLVGTNFVVDTEDLLPILNDAERGVDSKQKPLDRHLAAFIAARAGMDVEGYLEDFNDRDEAVSAMAILQLYSQLQSKFGPEVLLGLTRWVGGQVGPVIRLFHSRATRRHLEGEIPQIVRRGSLPELLALLNDAETKAKDQMGFTQAVSEFQKAEAEIAEITANSRPGTERVQRTSRQVAAVLSVLLMVCVLSVIIMAR